MTTERYRKPESVKDLERAYIKQQAEEHPNFPAEYIPKKTFRDDTANGLTNCVIAFVTLNGGQAERINTMGRVVMRSAKQMRGGKLVDVQRPEYIPTNGTRGSADVSATINGRSVKIEIKVGKDRQREDQKIYQQAIERAGGIYYIARDFTTFVEWYKSTFVNTINTVNTDNI